MHGEDRIVRGKANSSWGYLFFVTSSYVFHLHTPGLRQVYKMMLYMCFNMLVEGNDSQAIQARTLLHLQPLIIISSKHVHLIARNNTVLPGVLQCTGTCSRLVRPVCRH